MYRNRYQRNMRDRSDGFDHNNVVSPTSGQMHSHNYEYNRNSSEKVWKSNHQKDKSFENDEESSQQHSNSSLNNDRKRNQYQQDKYNNTNNNNMDDHKRNRDRMMKFDKDKYSLRMPSNDMRDRSQNKREDGK